MSRFWRTWGTVALVGLLALTLAAACDDDDDDGGVDLSPTATSTDTATAEPTDTATETPEATNTPDDGETTPTETTEPTGPLTATLEGVDGNGISGTATVEAGADGASIVVTLDVTGLPEGGHANHIHEGSCEEQGNVVVPLNDIVAEADTAAQQETTAEGSVDDYATGHYVAIHESSTDDGVGAVIACGNLS